MTMSLEAEAIAQQARAKYEASLETLKSFLRNFPSITQRVEEHDARLGLLENKFMKLKDDISLLVTESKKVTFSSSSATRRFSKETVSVSIDERMSSSNEIKTETKRLSIEREIVSVTFEEQASSVASAETVTLEEPISNLATVETVTLEEPSCNIATVETVTLLDPDANEAAVETITLEDQATSARSSEAKDDTSEQESLAEDATPTRSVSFTEDKANIWRYSSAEIDAIIPGHGHWLPDAVTAHRLSFQNANDFTRQLGGRVVKLQTGIESTEPIDCILVEPMGKILSPNEYISTGLMVCLHGTAHEPEVLAEWGEVLKLTKLLDAGMSMALPDLSALAEQGDVEAVLEAILKQASYDRCILTGKDWGGQMAMEIACGTQVSDFVDGVLLMAPASPVPDSIGRVECPVLLLWAENDNESPFSEIRDWYQALQDRSIVSCTKDLSRGGHSFAEVLKEGETSQLVLFFIVSALLINQLCQSIDEASCAGEDARVTDSAFRLCDELPPFLANQVGGDAEEGVAAALTSRDPARVKRRMHRLIEALRDWISAGLQEMASATE